MPIVLANAIFTFRYHGGALFSPTSSDYRPCLLVAATLPCSLWPLDTLVRLLPLQVLSVSKQGYEIGFALTLVWVSNAVPRPPAKRAVAIGIVNGFGNIGNLCVVSSLRHDHSLIYLTPIGSDHLPGKLSGALITTPLCG